MRTVTALKSLMAVFAAVAVVGSTSIAFAQDDVPPPSSGGPGWMTQGAEILPVGTYAFDARVGFPSLDLGVHIPLTPVFEITPFLSFDYLGYGWWGGGNFGNTLGVQLKGQVWQSGPHAISLGADLGICLNYIGWKGFDVGLQLGGPEVKYSYRWDDPRIAIIAGLRMPIRIWFLNGLWGEIPVLFNVGFEYNVLPNLNIHANLEFGPVFGGWGGAATRGWNGVSGHGGFQFGISYLF